jgi:hypothetical protein
VRKSCDHISINVCFAVAIVINKLSHLSDRVFNSCWRRKVRNLFQLFHLVKNSTKEESVQIVSNGNYRCFALSAKPCKTLGLVNRKVFRIVLHATASKSSPRKAMFSSVQEQSQHQPKGNFLEEHIYNVSSLFEINETQVLKGYSNSLPQSQYCYSNTSRQLSNLHWHNGKNISSIKETINSLFLFHF